MPEIDPRASRLLKAIAHADGIEEAFGLDVDVTEQEQLTQELRKSEEQLRLSEERYAPALVDSHRA